ncbi:hypothetical protein YC2023_118220 [Brassica napus]
MKKKTSAPYILVKNQAELCILDVERTTTSNQDAKKNANLSGQQSFSKLLSFRSSVYFQCKTIEMSICLNR